MEFEKLNLNWNAEPNAPEPTLEVENGNIILKFYLNYFLYEQFDENDLGKLTFFGCEKYSFNGMNDEGYYCGQYRYSYKQLPWGEFYKLKTNYNDFPNDYVKINDIENASELNHYIFFFRDNTFECIAENYKFEILKN